MAQPGRPVLWHIKVSHYNEKARWALDHKEIEHDRRAPIPGSHMLFALWLTRGRGKTFPVLELDGERIGDSTRIIEALERRYPDPPLYPADPEERARALALEDFFDEEFAPYVRRLVWHEAVKDPERFAEWAAQQVPAPLNRRTAPAGAFASMFVKLRYGAASDEAAEIARAKIVTGLDRLDAELGTGDYLVGDRFTVADLTAASLMYPLVRPPEGPRVEFDPPEPLQRFFDSLSGRRGYEWTAEMFRRHRRRAPAPAPA